MIATLLRVVLSLGTVLGLMWVVARFMPGRVRVRSNTLLNVVARQPLGRNASLSVVTVGDRVLVLGVTDQKVTLVTEMDTDELQLGDTVTSDTVPTVQTVRTVPTLVEPAPLAETGVASASVPAASQVSVAAAQIVDVAASDSSPVAGRRRRVDAPDTATVEADVPAPAKQATQVAEQHAFAAMLQGSILSPQTWKQAAAVSRGTSGTHRGRRVAS